MLASGAPACSEVFVGAGVLRSLARQAWQAQMECRAWAAKYVGMTGQRWKHSITPNAVFMEENAAHVVREPRLPNARQWLLRLLGFHPALQQGAMPRLSQVTGRCEADGCVCRPLSDV